ncbi:MAG TPA: hypothetical protein P5057_10195, partial [Acidobacteriota bacterium]|nr:hypothetical protein [Acidobacteriota bacterium]
RAGNRVTLPASAARLLHGRKRARRLTRVARRLMEVEPSKKGIQAGVGSPDDRWVKQAAGSA